MSYFPANQFTIEATELAQDSDNAVQIDVSECEDFNDAVKSVRDMLQSNNVAIVDNYRCDGHTFAEVVFECVYVDYAQSTVKIMAY